jgi:hypothetical protein
MLCTSFGAPNRNTFSCVYTRDAALSVAVFLIAMFSHIMGWLLPLCLVNSQIDKITVSLVQLTMDGDGIMCHQEGNARLTVSAPMR